MKERITKNISYIFLTTSIQIDKTESVKFLQLCDF